MSAFDRSKSTMPKIRMIPSDSLVILSSNNSMVKESDVLFTAFASGAHATCIPVVHAISI